MVEQYSLNLQRLLALEWKEEEILRELTESDDVEVLENLGRNPNSTEEILMKIINSSKPMSARLIAVNNVGLEVLEELSKSCNDEKRCLAASSKNSDKNILQRLSLDKAEIVMMAVAGNVKTPVEVLERMSEKCSFKVGEQIANNERASREAINNLIWNTDRMLRDLAVQVVEKRCRAIRHIPV